MMDDALLLRRYVEEHSEPAFTELVQRHVNLVYFAALRRTRGDRHLAGEIAQSVFTTLARKAAALTGHTTLTGWLFTATQFAAREQARAEWRRQHREQKAHAMNEILSDSAREPEWDQVKPVIDDALRDLASLDRDAVLLRFFENRPYAEVGAALHLSENSARMRVDRALEKLRAALARRGVTSTAAALTTALAAPASFAAPAGLVQQLTTTALAGVAATGAGWSLSVLISAMTTAKFTAIATSLAALLAVGIAVRQHQQLESSRTEFAALGAKQARLQSLVNDLESRLAAARAPAAMVEAADGLVATATPGVAAPPAPITRDMVEARLKSAKEFAQRGQSAEALGEYLWCYDIGMRQVDGYFHIRYTSLLQSITDLGKTYPPALDALRERRDAARARLLASATDMAAGKDFGQINRLLGEDAVTNALFDSLPEDDPRRGHIIESSMVRLLEAQRYREFAMAMPYAGMGQAWEQMVQIAHSPDLADNARAAMRRNVIKFAASQVEVRAGAGDLVDASDMIERLLVFDDSPDTVAAIKSHLERAGHPDLFKP